MALLSPIRLIPYISKPFFLIDDLIQGFSYRWQRFVSILIANRFDNAPGRVYMGKGCIIKGHKHIHLEGSFVALERNRIEAIERHGLQRFAPRLQFGNGVSMEYDCHIGCINEIKIGSRVLIASRVYISDHSHGGTTVQDLAVPPNERLLHSKGPVVIEDDVWLGEGVAVMPGVRIGHSSIIGANSVVTKDIPSNSVAAGAPARVIKLIT